MRNFAKSTISRTTRLCSALLAGLAFAAPVVQAREHLGPIDNLLLKNPYANPAGAFFGRGVVAGDVDNDGIDDLIVSENGGDRLRALLGNPFDVGSDPLFPFSPSTVSMPNHGYVMAAGDFDGDDRDEIAVAYPNSSVGGESGAGKVYVMNRRPADGEWEVQSTIQAGGAYPGAVQAQANLGNSLASGDFDDDGYDDLAIGMRGQVVGGFENAGAVMVVYGGILGVNGSYGAEIFDRDSDGLTFSPRINDYYGWALTTGDFDADGDADLAIGITGATCPNGTDRGGGVVVLNGTTTSTGLTTTGSKIWRPGTQGIGGDCATSDNFGGALATGEFGDRDFLETNYADLAIGANGTNGDQGAVHVIYGTASGLDAAGNEFILPPALPGVITDAGRFGVVLRAGRLGYECDGLNCSGDSLAIGAPFAVVNGVDNAGAVWVIDSGSDSEGLLVSTAYPILPLAPLRIDGPHENDQFGNDLAIGDFNGDNRDDLAIGAYLYDDGVDTDSGAVQVLYQTDILFKDGFDD
jgi:hypothetical protein